MPVNRTFPSFLGPRRSYVHHPEILVLEAIIISRHLQWLVQCCQFEKNIPQRPGVKNKSKTSQIQQVNNYYSYYLLRPKAMMASFLLMVTNRCLIEHYRTIYNRLVFRWIESMDDKSKMFLQLLFGNHHFKSEGFFFLHFLAFSDNL